jgi:hypothetical protein
LSFEGAQAALGRGGPGPAPITQILPDFSIK